MNPILYDESTITYGSVPQHNGLGVLSDALSCKVTEERNGSYELELTYPASGIHAKDIQLRHLIKAKPNFTDDPQLFRVYKIGKVLGSSFKVYARHISYDLSGSEITTGTAGSCVAACTLLSTTDFNITTDKNVVANFKITEPSSRRSWLGGKAGSLLDAYGTGEYHYDNFNIQLLLHRGTNRGVEVRYGKNLLSLNQERNSSNLTTAIILFWKDSESGEVVYSAKTSTGLTLDTPVVQCIDVSSDFESKPTVAQLNLKAQAYIADHNYAVIKNSIKLNFLQIGTLKDRVDLCDTVKIYYEDFNIEAEAKCVKTVWDVLDDKYTSIELGDLKSNFADTFISNNESTRALINANKTMLQIAIENATSLITGNEGGYVILHDSNDDGYPDEILIMNTPDIATATKVWRWNQSGLGYSKTGYAGTYGLAMTMDGAIVANFITTGTMSANRVRTGLLTSTNGKNYIDLDGNKAHFENLEITIGGTDTDAATAISNAATAAANAQTTANGKVSPNQVRTKFAADSTSVTINSGIITFNSNSFVVNADYFKVDKYGNVKASDISYNGFIKYYADNTYAGNPVMNIGSVYVIPPSGSGAVEPSIEIYEKNSGKIRVRYNVYPAMTGSTYQPSTLMTLFDDAGTRYTRIHEGGIQINASGGTKVFLNALQGYGMLTLYNASGTANIQAYGNNGNITCVSLTQTSTRKVKKNIKPMQVDEARKILEIEPVSYDFKDEAMGKDRRGLIAEDVEKIIPNVVGHDENGAANGILYTELIPYLIKMVQLQQDEIKHLKERI